MPIKLVRRYEVLRYFTQAQRRSQTLFFLQKSKFFSTSRLLWRENLLLVTRETGTDQLPLSAAPEGRARLDRCLDEVERRGGRNIDTHQWLHPGFGCNKTLRPWLLAALESGEEEEPN